MSALQTVFRRYELKYLLTREQYEAVRCFSLPYLTPDEYPDARIISLYYDTPSRSLIRRSLEHPLYKEKLRLRAYGIPGTEDTVFVELKKKYEGVVYKRRAAMRLREATAYLAGAEAPIHNQITAELDAALAFYRREGGLAPAMTITYERASWRSRNPGEDLRVTFDTDIRYRNERLSPAAGYTGKRVIGASEVLMEIKTGRAVPLWLCEVLDKYGIYKTSFSKYGRAYLMDRGFLAGVPEGESDMKERTENCV